VTLPAVVLVVEIDAGVAEARFVGGSHEDHLALRERIASGDFRRAVERALDELEGGAA
jgi:hypothetical protein